MDLFKDILGEHFPSPKREEMLLLLNKYELTDLIGRHAIQLKDHVQKTMSNNGKAPLPALTATASNLLIAINSKVIHISDPIEKRKIQEFIANISVRMFASIIKLFPNESLQIVDSVNEGLQTTANLWSYDYNDIDQLLKLSEFKEMIKSIDGSSDAKKIRKIQQGPIPYIKWTQRCDIGFLTTELKAKGWIKSQNGFASLFNNQDGGLKVHWHANHLYELARLLFILHSKDFIRPVPSRGYFSIAERYLVDFSEKPLAKNALKKLSSKMTQEPDKYKDIISVIDEVMSKLLDR